MRKILIIIFFLPIAIFSQTHKVIEVPTYTNVFKSDNGYMLSGIIVEGDTLPYVKLYKIVIFPERKFKSKRQQRRYNRLAYNVKVVYPYAVLIGKYYQEIEHDLQYIHSESERRKYIKKKEKQLRNEYEDALINLTFSQGRLLIKLVDRETSHTTFEVIQELKGNMSAYFWQSLALMFGSNLRSEYDPTEEDKWIEEIIAQIENGQLK
jgi:hypothetical protein